jgi:hypothetical protein
MDKRLGKDGGRMPVVCATSGRLYSHGQPGTRIGLGNGFYCFVRAVSPPMDDKLKDELRKLAQPKAQKKVKENLNDS